MHFYIIVDDCVLNIYCKYWNAYVILVFIIALVILNWYLLMLGVIWQVFVCLVWAKMLQCVQSSFFDQQTVSIKHNSH